MLNGKEKDSVKMTLTGVSVRHACTDVKVRDVVPGIDEPSAAQRYQPQACPHRAAGTTIQEPWTLVHP